MWKNDTEIYKEVIEARALDYLKNYRETTDIVNYLEFHGGPIIMSFMRKLSVAQVVNDFDLEVYRQSQ